ncbi:hypothetical protein PN498_23170 [Oscillatoria sp. CS-180]|uniref:hypothetical protein n=1 Tax=Oscillatoria sp. CS-180 TaxID=3021720 RepID=UPI00232AD183|nr:hypothetical protein [Oscillatoria sp. CS-180]MDB9528913.1 hypothetical protein [Oscillatoria sp. CS-180]
MSILTEQYLNLVNRQLPAAAQKGGYPVRFNHCFARIILDNICGCEWYQVIEKPAYKNMTEEQLQQAIALGKTFLVDPQACVEANQTSLRYRNKQA